MYSFANKNGISVLADGKEVIKNITAWINPKLNPYKPNPYNYAGVDDKTFLDVVSVDEKEIVLRQKDGVADLILSLVQDEKGNFAIHAKGKYDYGYKLGFGTHLDPFCGLGFDFDFPHTGNYIDGYMTGLFWQRPAIESKSNKIKPRTQALFYKQKDRTVYLSATCHKAFKTEIFPEKKGASLHAQSNTRLEEIDEVVLIGGINSNIYKLSEQVASFGFKVMGKKGTIRKNKKYPEVFEYLGWCSWDAFHMEVTHQNIVDKMQEFKGKKIPVKWMILDDMWGEVPGDDLKTMHSRELAGWEAAPDRFPNGLKGVVDDVKKFGIKLGIWHPTSGYWAGCQKDGTLAKEHGDLMEYTIPGYADDDYPRYMHSFDRKKCEKFYDYQHKFYKECGVDFTKVDNQGSTQKFSYLKGSINECCENLHNAIEKAANKYYGGALINCMGMPIENCWNRTSNINRFSGDFQPENRKWFVQHLLQCSYNSLSQGAIYTGDWDMWWSDDDQASKNAVLRSMSGGPIYMSDELNRSIRSVIMPTVLSDGKIIRLNNPALPTADCLFEDAEHNKKIFKVFNKIDEVGVIAAFNLDENEETVSGTVSAEDIEGLKNGRYAVYDWFNKKVTVLEKGEVISLALENYDDFRLFLFAPIKNGKAVIGLSEKYMARGAVKKTDDGFVALDDGSFTVYSETEPKGYKKISDNLFFKQVKKDEIISF